MLINREKLAKKINNSCNVRRAKLIAIAHTNNGHVIATATNMVWRGQPRWTIHAEEGLIRKLHKIKAKERYGNISVTVMRLSSVKGWTLAKPCARCRAYMGGYGIRTVWYTDTTGKLVKLNEL